MAESFLSKLLFTILKIICWAVNRLTQLFEIFSGLTKVSFNGERIFLFDVFLNNTAINNIYWGMALIGIVLCFGFAIFAVVRKMFDSAGRVQMSIGQIITEGLKSILLILSMNAILTVTLTGTDILMRQVNYLFTNAEGLSQAESITYTDEQCAAMGRALGTIANYGMNPSFNSRYNLNDCFNTIRPDLIYLEDQGVFDYHYPQDSDSWQSILQEVAASADLRYELKADVYYENVAKSLQHALDVMRTDSSFRPLEQFKKENTALLQIPLDRVIFLSGTLDAANNSYYNVNPSFTDALRYPYYSGEKSLYDTDTVDSIDVISSDFSISYARFDYLVSIVLGVAILINTFVILLSLVARMFNILLLYVIAPPVLAVRPLDGGGKSKQWAIAFMIQALGVFGNIVVMRLLLIFVPVIFDANLVLIADSAAMNYFAKAVMLFAAYSVAKKASGLLTGIISDSAAMQSTHAADMKEDAMQAIGQARSTARNALHRVGAAAGFAAAPALNYFSKPFDAWRSLGKSSDKEGGSGNKGGGTLPGANRPGDKKPGSKGGGSPKQPKPPAERPRSRSMPNPSAKGIGDELPLPAKQKAPGSDGSKDGSLPKQPQERQRSNSMPNSAKKAADNKLPPSGKQQAPGSGDKLPPSGKQQPPSGSEKNVPFDLPGPEIGRNEEQERILFDEDLPGRSILGNRDSDQLLGGSYEDDSGFGEGERLNSRSGSLNGSSNNVSSDVPLPQRDRRDSLGNQSVYSAFSRSEHSDDAGGGDNNVYADLPRQEQNRRSDSLDNQSVYSAFSRSEHSDGFGGGDNYVSAGLPHQEQNLRSDSVNQNKAPSGLPRQEQGGRFDSSTRNKAPSDLPHSGGETRSRTSSADYGSASGPVPGGSVNKRAKQPPQKGPKAPGGMPERNYTDRRSFFQDDGDQHH